MISLILKFGPVALNKLLQSKTTTSKFLYQCILITKIRLSASPKKLDSNTGENLDTSPVTLVTVTPASQAEGQQALAATRTCQKLQLWLL